MFLLMTVKKGGNTSQLEGRLGLVDFINKEDLMALDLQGIKFTWSNKRVGNKCIQVHLDRGIISLYWTKDSICLLTTIQKKSSNHFPLLFKFEPIQTK